MTVFVVNTGSSSVKAAAFSGATPAAIPLAPDWSAEIRWSELPARAQLSWESGAEHGTREVAVDAHGSAAVAVVEAARDFLHGAPEVIGHRIVHGLTESTCTFIDGRVRALIERAAELAPLHNRAALAGIDAAAQIFPGVRQAADFDTAFHTTLPAAAAAYALPYDWFTERGVRRYGFHGISHRYCAGRSAELLAADVRELRIVSAHLGNGCSLAAIARGVSVDTTMGFTPLEGVVMGSRSGSVDPGLVLHLLQSGAYRVDELDRILNEKSGLAGLSQVSEDVRAVIAAAEQGAPAAQLALDVYVHRLGAAVAAMAASMNGLDVLAFTGGVGENSAYVRERTCRRLAFLGIALRAQPADAHGDRQIGAEHAAVRVVVVQAREEFAIARDVARLITPDAAISPVVS